MSITNKRMNELFRSILGKQKNTIVSIQKDAIKSELKRVANFYEDPEGFIESKKYGRPKIDWLDGFIFIEMPEGYEELNSETKKWAEQLGFKVIQFHKSKPEVCLKIKFDDETLKAIEAFK